MPDTPQSVSVWFSGASDCAACVGAALEAARVLVADAGISLPGPVVFLFNGGEETVLQASHGALGASYQVG